MTWNGATCEWCDEKACTVCNKQRNMERRMSEKTRFNPYESIEPDNPLGEGESVNIRITPRSETFFDRDGHGDAFNAHPLAWESIPYRSEE